jgi:hypothetical protein
VAARRVRSISSAIATALSVAEATPGFLPGRHPLTKRQQNQLVMVNALLSSVVYFVFR